MAGRGREKFQKAKPLILAAARFYRIFPLKIRIKLLEHYRGMKGAKGLALRYALLQSITKHCGDNVSIHPGVYLLHPQGLSLGDNVSIHPMCYLDATGGITIGNDVSIAHGCARSSQRRIPIKTLICRSRTSRWKHTRPFCRTMCGAARRSPFCAALWSAPALLSGRTPWLRTRVPENTIVAGVPAREIKTR